MKTALRRPFGSFNLKREENWASSSIDLELALFSTSQIYNLFLPINLMEDHNFMSQLEATTSSNPTLAGVTQASFAETRFL